MCGIYGEYFPNNLLSKKEQFLKANDLNTNRGPDMSGYWTDSNSVQLGFRRLSIMDVSDNGNQPMVSKHQKYAMVFNGEIYNFNVLKQELLSRGYTFKSESDSEVLVNYFECFGIQKTLDVIEGMFAIGLYDIANKSISLIRDFAGIKPLFYSYDQGNVVFGSRYDQVAKHNNSIDNAIEQEVLKTYLKMHYIPAPYGILEDTFQVYPGECVNIDSKGKLSKYIYWEFPALSEEDLISDKEEALQFLDSKLKESVKDQLEADVPLGTFLSGGIDSPLVTSYAKASKDNLKAFTIGSDSKVHDESEDAKTYASLIGVDMLLEKMVASDAKKILKDCMLNLQEPFADYSIIPTYELTKNASKSFTVMLSGDGGDELFFGYERFHSVAKNFKFTWLPHKLRYLAYGVDKLLFKNKHMNSCILSDTLSDAHKGLHSRTNTSILEKVFPSMVGIDEKTLPFYKYSEKLTKNQFLHEMRKAEFYGMMQKTLTKVDRMSMANSIEVRVPFLQKKVIEAALKIHPKLSLKKSQKKLILKNLLRKLVPNSPIDNKKRGFSVPLSKWLREDLKDDISEGIFEDSFTQKFGVDKAILMKIWKEHQEGKKDHKWFLFTIYSLQQWHENLKK